METLKQFLADANQGKRGGAAAALLSLEVGEERKRTEFLPLVIPLLADRAKGVRRDVASVLREWAAEVPLEVAAGALAREMNGRVRKNLAPLVLAILAAREKKTVL